MTPHPSPATETLRFYTGDDAFRLRADLWLCQRFPEVSRSQVQRWFRDGRVTRAGDTLKAGEELGPGQTLLVRPPPPESETLPAAEDLALEILHEDGCLLVLNKPPGLVVHPAPGHAGGTLVNAVLHHVPAIAGVGDPRRPGLVHRLDADTSGVIVFAKTPAALEFLQKQFQERRLHKEYQCLVHGVPQKADGEIDLPLGRHPADRKRRAVNGLAARPAFSRYVVEEGLAAGTAARLRVEIETGRTHQIRVHLAHVGHPVLGDGVYGGRRAQLSSPWPRASRQMLHAFRLRFAHPDGKGELDLSAPLPADMAAFLTSLKSPPSP